MHLSAANLLQMYEVRELLEDEGARRATQRFDSLLDTDQRVCRRLDQRVVLENVLTAPVTWQYSWRTGVERCTK